MNNCKSDQDTPKVITVLVSVTLSKQIKICLPKDQEYDLREEVEKQVYLPQDAGAVMKNSDVASLESIADNFSGWSVDDYEVIED